MHPRRLPLRLRTDADPNPHAHTDTYSHSDPDADANWHSNTDTHHDADADANSNSYRDANANPGACPNLLRLPEPRQLPHALLHAGKGEGVPEKASRVQDRSLSRRISDAADELLFPSRRPVGFRR